MNEFLKTYIDNLNKLLSLRQHQTFLYIKVVKHGHHLIKVSIGFIKNIVPHFIIDLLIGIFGNLATQMYYWLFVIWSLVSTSTSNKFIGFSEKILLHLRVELYQWKIILAIRSLRRIIYYFLFEVLKALAYLISLSDLLKKTLLHLRVEPTTIDSWVILVEIILAIRSPRRIIYYFSFEVFNKFIKFIE